jgi:hypothetical protein
VHQQHEEQRTTLFFIRMSLVVVADAGVEARIDVINKIGPCSLQIGVKLVLRIVGVFAIPSIYGRDFFYGQVGKVRKEVHGRYNTVRILGQISSGVREDN